MVSQPCQLLEDKGIKSNMKWEDALKLIQEPRNRGEWIGTANLLSVALELQLSASSVSILQEDRRFGALAAAGERKQAFAEYITQSKKREKEEEREKRKKAKDDFIDALTAWKDLKLTTRYKDAAEHFYNEEWFKLLEEDERDLPTGPQTPKK